MSSGCATGLVSSRDLTPRSCTAGLWGSFVQLSERQFSLDQQGWRDQVALLRAVGARTVVVQFTGDERGPFDRRWPQTPPVRQLLDSAAAAGLTVWLGLHADPAWPAGRDLERHLPAPLDDPEAAARLAALCAGNAACEGFYLSPEIDDHRGLPDSARVTRFLSRTTSVLRALAPGKRISMAPYFSGVLSPEDHAAFWRPVLAARLVDVFMLQDGVGTGRASPVTARRYLEALRAVMPADTGPAANRVAGGDGGARTLELWAVVELFRQTAGPPLDQRPFAAGAANFDVVSSSLAHEGAAATRLVGFSVPDYMDPRTDAAARRLYLRYRDWCASGTSATSS